MSVLAQVVQAVESQARFVDEHVRAARNDPKTRDEILSRWKSIRANIATVQTPTGLRLPRLALPDIDEAGEIARFVHGEGLPGEFPYATAAYHEMYLDPMPRDGAPAPAKTEEPTRLFAGLGLAEDTNARFRYLTRQQRSARLSTAFDGPTLYGLDSDADGVLGKIGEGGVAVDTVEDMQRLYAGFELGRENVSVSMTINGPAPAILAMFIAAAKRRFGDDVVPHLRGTIQADILKEVQAQNECLFPLDASLRFLADMVEWTNSKMPRWYPISISGYHIAEAGATPVQQAAYTLSNGFAYAELFRSRGMDVNVFGPRLSFFLDCGLDVEYLALSRVCRKIWAIGMRDVFSAEPRAQVLKLHTQTSGRSLVAQSFKNNLTRTGIELMLAYINATNSCHSNSADEPFTTPGEEYVKLAANAQAILLEESGLFKHTMNLLGSSPGVRAVEQAVQAAVLEEFRQIEQLGGVLQAIEHRYQRSQIQAAAHRYEQQIYDGVRPVIGLNRYVGDKEILPELKLARTPASKRRLQADRVRKFKHRHRKESQQALDALEKTVDAGGNVFAELINTVEHCSLGQITERLQEVVGHYRPTI
ncbi:MAG TPA: methylmalonyl-CoA mutase family protein [Tepidisphaeraceae bacterium]|jgi:methylmalonyl-CoA mutase|nr:methylmalonyl-CoA mutase family protein [Tepidisphaeraceae bacterium]